MAIRPAMGVADDARAARGRACPSAPASRPRTRSPPTARAAGRSRRSPAGRPHTTVSWRRQPADDRVDGLDLRSPAVQDEHRRAAAGPAPAGADAVDVDELIHGGTRHAGGRRRSARAMLEDAPASPGHCRRAHGAGLIECSTMSDSMSTETIQITGHGGDEIEAYIGPAGGRGPARRRGGDPPHARL